MNLPTLALYVLCHVPQATGQPVLPDLEPLVYSASTLSTIPPNKRLDWKERIEEGVALARYLNRARNRMALHGEAPNECSNYMCVLQQLDAVLTNLNPNPSTEEVVARARAYREWFCVIHRGFELKRGAGEDMRNTDFHFERAIRCFEENYWPLFSQDFRSCDPSKIPPLPTMPTTLPPLPQFTPNSPPPPAGTPR